MNINELMQSIDLRRVREVNPTPPRELIENVRMTLDAFECAKAAYAAGFPGSPEQLNTTANVLFLQVPTLLKALGEALDERDAAHAAARAAYKHLDGYGPIIDRAGGDELESFRRVIEALRPFSGLSSEGGDHAG